MSEASNPMEAVYEHTTLSLNKRGLKLPSQDLLTEKESRFPTNFSVKKTQMDHIFINFGNAWISFTLVLPQWYLKLSQC